MQQLTQQLGTLLLGAIPTILLFVVLVAAYQFLIQRPLATALEERNRRTKGAVEDARRAIALAEERAGEYATKLRQARAEVYKARELRVKQWTAERDAALEIARKAAGQKVGEARAALDAEAAAARRSIESSIGELAAQAVRAVMPAAAGGAR